MQKVLVVDDEPELVRMLGQTLGAAGFSAVGAASGERALELLGQQEFDAALVDKNLGRGIDGVEVIRHLRRRQPRCACIVMTAYPSTGSAVEALRVGAQDYVEKPSPELDTIADRVQSAIRKARASDGRAMESAEALLWLARFVRAPEKLIAAIEAHISSLR